MKKIILTTLLVLNFTVNAQDHYEVEGTKVPRTIEFNGQKLQLNGYGARSKMFIDIYIQALYMSHFLPNAKDIVASNTTMAIRIQVVSSLVTSKKLTKALNKGLARSVGENGIKKIEPQVKMLEELLGREDTKVGDAFNLIYNSKSEEIYVHKNDKLEGKIPGIEFKKAFFGIWLSENPVDASLKEDLLGY